MASVMLMAAGMDELNAVAHTELQPGWDVYDVDGDLIGTVEEVGETSFTVLSAGPVSMTLAVAFDDIESADESRVDLNLTASELAESAESPT